MQDLNIREPKGERRVFGKGFKKEEKQDATFTSCADFSVAPQLCSAIYGHEKNLKGYIPGYNFEAMPNNLDILSAFLFQK